MEMDKKKVALMGAAAVVGAVGAAVTAKKVYECVCEGGCDGSGNCECDGDCACGQCGEPEDGVPAPDVGAAPEAAIFTPTPGVPD